MIDENDVPKGSLSKQQIFLRLGLPKSPERLVITPLVDQKKGIEDGSIDLRLGTEFIVTRRSKITSLDPLEERYSQGSKILEYQEKIYVNIGNKLILHPHQFALGCTFEYIKMPVDLMGYVIGRSSWGRVGLVIATATVVHPSYAGVITLELTNVGDTPIALYPGLRVAQLAFHEIYMSKDERNAKWQQATGLKTKYTASVGPQFSKFYLDDDLKIIERLKDKIRF